MVFSSILFLFIYLPVVLAVLKALCELLTGKQENNGVYFVEMTPLLSVMKHRRTQATAFII